LCRLCSGSTCSIALKSYEGKTASDKINYPPTTVSDVYLVVEKRDIESKRLPTILGPDGDALAVGLLRRERKLVFWPLPLLYGILISLDYFIASLDCIGDRMVQHLIMNILHEGPLSGVIDLQLKQRSKKILLGTLAPLAIVGNHHVVDKPCAAHPLLQ
jgi:hypothetical protein